MVARPPYTRFSVAALLLAVVVSITVWVLLQDVSPYLSHDEAVYANRARAWMTGDVATGWRFYRPAGLPALAYPALHVSDSTLAVRAVTLLLALGAVCLIYFIASSVTTPGRAGVSVLVIVSGVTYLRRLPEFLNDISVSALLLLVAYLVLLCRRKPTAWALPAAAAVAVLAVMVRYGAVSSLLAIAAAAVLVWGKQWLRDWRQIALAAAVMAVGLAPLLLYSRRQTGSWLGVFTAAREMGYRAHLGDGLVYYAQAFPFKLAGALGAVVLTAGIAVTIQCLVKARSAVQIDKAVLRERAFLGLAALLLVLLIGIDVHGETRYILFSVYALTIIGVDAIATWAGPRARTALIVTGALAVASIPVNTVLVALQMSDATAARASVGSVAQHIADVNADRPCVVVVSDLAVEAAWVSRCEGITPRYAAATPDDATVYVIDFPDSPDWSASEQVKRALPARTWESIDLGEQGELGRAVLSASRPTP